MPLIMEIVKVFRDVEMIVALCHRSWGNRKCDSAFSFVEQIVAPCLRDVVPQVQSAVMVVPLIMQRRCVLRHWKCLRFSSSPEFADSPVRS